MEESHPDQKERILGVLLTAFIPVGVVISIGLRWPSLLLLTIPGLIHVRAWRHVCALLRRMTLCHYAVLAIASLYIVAYNATTTYKPYGSGGLTGTVHVREFQSECHLLPFYPVYLVERWVRNQSFTYSAYRFNCDFSDGIYVHGWLYGDGKYGQIWYDADPAILLGLLGSVCLIVGMLRQFVRMPWWFAVSYGFISVFLVIAAFSSAWMAAYYSNGGFSERTEDFSSLYAGDAVVVGVAVFLLSSCSPVPGRHRSNLAAVIAVLLGLCLIQMVPGVALRQSTIFPYLATFATASFGGLFALDAVRFCSGACRVIGGLMFLLFGWFMAFSMIPLAMGW